MNYDWPGNVRELQNVIERAVILTSDGILRLPENELKRAMPPPLRVASGRVDTLKKAERDCILHALEEANWVVGGSRGAAARLGIPRTTLIYKMRKLGITRSQRPLSTLQPSAA
jgi:transcriptional regulator with GAF, ATPase, and Fis domain